MRRLNVFGLNITAVCIATIGTCGLAEAFCPMGLAVPPGGHCVSFNDENSLNAMPQKASNSFAFNRTEAGMLTNYKEDGMLLLDGVHPPDPALGAQQYLHYHLGYEDTETGNRIIGGSDRTTDPATLGRTLSSHEPDQAIQLTYDPNNTGQPQPFDMIRIDVRRGVINVGVRGPFGIAVYNNLTAGFRWTLIDATGLTRATLEGIGENYEVDNIIFQPDPPSARVASAAKSRSVSKGNTGEQRRAVPEELTDSLAPAINPKFHDFLHHDFVRRVAVDVLPLAECGNGIEPASGTPRNDTLKVAVLGAADFDLTQINPDTVLLEGVAPRSLRFANVTARVPFAADRCALEGPDEFIDLVAQFDLRELRDAVLASPAIGDLRPLLLSGSLRDGTRFEGADAIFLSD